MSCKIRQTRIHRLVEGRNVLIDDKSRDVDALAIRAGQNEIYNLVSHCLRGVFFDLLDFDMVRKAKLYSLQIIIIYLCYLVRKADRFLVYLGQSGQYLGIEWGLKEIMRLLLGRWIFGEGFFELLNDHLQIVRGEPYDREIVH